MPCHTTCCTIPQHLHYNLVQLTFDLYLIFTWLSLLHGYNHVMTIFSPHNSINMASHLCGCKAQLLPGSAMSEPKQAAWYSSLHHSRACYTSKPATSARCRGSLKRMLTATLVRAADHSTRAGQIHKAHPRWDPHGGGPHQGSGPSQHCAHPAPCQLPGPGRTVTSCLGSLLHYQASC